MYDRAWELFQDFLNIYKKALHALAESDLIEFISLLSLIPLAPRMIKTYISGVRHHLKIHLLPDFAKSFMIALLLKGLTLPEDDQDICLLISLSMLHGMHEVLLLINTWL